MGTSRHWTSESELKVEIILDRRIAYLRCEQLPGLPWYLSAQKVKDSVLELLLKLCVQNRENARSQKVIEVVSIG